MNQCSLCMTENHPDAVVCKSCGATKAMVQQKAGFIRGIGIMGLGVIGLFLLLGGKFMAGFIFMGGGIALAWTTPRKLMWIRHVG